MGIFNFNIPFVNKFLSHFAVCFSKKQMLVFIIIIYALFKDYKRNSLMAMAQITNCDYQKIQYFLSDSKWNTHHLNNIRLKIIENQRTTASTSSGNLVIDDTASPKPHAKATEGAHRQYCGVLGREEICNVAVFSAFCSKSKHFPINFKSYLPAKEFYRGKNNPSFKTKLDLAKILIDEALEKQIKFSYLLMDSWYAQSSNLLEFIHFEKQIPFIGEVKSDRNIFFYNPAERKHRFFKQDELVKLIKKYYSHKCKGFSFTSKDGKKKTSFTYTFKGTLKDCSVPLRFIVVFGKWDDADDKNVHILITNQTHVATNTIISNYLLRWGIELIFRELKDIFFFDQYQLRHKKQIERYWMLCLIVWSLVYCVKQNAFLNKILVHKPSSFNSYKQAINTLLLYDSTCALSKNDELAENYFKIKSKRLKQRLAHKI